MSGYIIFEHQYLNSFKPDGISPNSIRIGLLDFLRELNSEAENIPKYSSFMVMGIDDVLYLSKMDEKRAILFSIRKILQTPADTLQRKQIQVQIVCKGKLKQADSFWLEYRDQKLPIDYIFGTPIRQDIRSYPVYTTGFNLSS